jgi:hypothetical protein
VFNAYRSRPTPVPPPVRPGPPIQAAFRARLAANVSKLRPISDRISSSTSTGLAFGRRQNGNTASTSWFATLPNILTSTVTPASAARRHVGWRNAAVAAGVAAGLAAAAAAASGAYSGYGYGFGGYGYGGRYYGRCGGGAYC